MFLIQAIRYLIAQIELNLNTRLGENSAEKFLSQLLKAKEPQPVAPVALVQSPIAIEEELLHKLTELKLIEVNDKQVTSNPHALDLAYLGLGPINILKDPRSRFYQQKLALVDAQIDAVPLHFGLTWGQLMNTTYEEFHNRLTTTLKNDDLTHTKMIILERFKRQLMLLIVYAEKVLLCREGVARLSKDQVVFRDSVDAWLVAMVNECVSEAKNLAEQALENAKIKITKSIAIEKNPGETEGMLEACKTVVEDFLKFSQEADAKDGIKKSAPNAMVDALPNRPDKSIALKIINEKVAQELAERLFQLASYQHRPKAGWYYSDWNPVGFDPDKAKAKNVSLATALHSFEEQASKHKTEDAGYWSEIFKLVHSAQQSATQLTPALSVYKQKATKTWQDVHAALYGQLPFEADSVKQVHRSCML